MRYLTLITFLIIYTLVSPTRAAYQSGYNPKEEYNCRYSLGSERMFFHEKIERLADMYGSQDIIIGPHIGMYIIHIYIYNTVLHMYIPILKPLDPELCRHPIIAMIRVQKTSRP